MKKTMAMLLWLVCLCLSGCQGDRAKAEFEKFSTALSSAQGLSFRANVRAEYEDRTARFTLSYSEDSKGAEISVLAPELIAGITARVEAGGTRLEYDTVVLDTGFLDSFGLSPMSSLPRLVQAMKSAHVDSFWQEDDFTVLQLEPDDMLKCRVWFETETMTPARAELISGGRVTVYIEIMDWNLM